MKIEWQTKTHAGQSTPLRVFFCMGSLLSIQLFFHHNMIDTGIIKNFTVSHIP